MAHVTLSDTADWTLASGVPDICGYDVVDADGVRLGRVEALVADTSLEVVSTVLLDDGTGIPAVSLTVRDGVVTVDRRSSDAISAHGLAPDGSGERDSPTGLGLGAGYGARVVRRT